LSPISGAVVDPFPSKMALASTLRISGLKAVRSPMSGVEWTYQSTHKAYEQASPPTRISNTFRHGICMAGSNMHAINDRAGIPNTHALVLARSAWDQVLTEKQFTMMHQRRNLGAAM